MLPRKHRLNLSSHTSFTKDARRLFSPEFQIATKGSGGSGAIFEVAISVSKKVAKKAVDRNRIRRLVSESLRKNIDNIKFKGKVHIVVKKDVSNLHQTEVQHMVLKLFNKL